MAFVALVGLYACNVRRLRNEERKPANFLALAVAFCVCRLGCCFGCFGCAGCVGYVGCVVGGSFSLRTI